MTDAPKRIWLQDDGDYEGARNSMAGTDTGVTWADNPINDNDTEYLRADLVPDWSSDMDAAPRDGSRVLTFHPANPKAIIERARRDNIVWNAVKAGQWWYSLPEQPPTRWMRVDPPKEGE